MDHIKELKSLITGISRRHDTFQVFRDFAAMAAISLSNAVDLAQAPSREAEYTQIIKRYSRDELAHFPKMLAALTCALEDDMADILGRLFHELELASKWTGQFFTPDCVCRMMAKMNLGGDARAIIEERGYLRASEPCVGAGAMVIALARELRAQGINYQQCLHVTAADIDMRAVHMAYTQLSLLHVPAVIIHGNTLSLEEWSHWYTPAHILGFWNGKLARGEATDRVPSPVPALPPVPAVSRVPEPRRGSTQLELF